MLAGELDGRRQLQVHVTSEEPVRGYTAFTARFDTSQSSVKIARRHHAGRVAHVFISTGSVKSCGAASAVFAGEFAERVLEVRDIAVGFTEGDPLCRR